jgi:hypothetical protein
MYQQIIGGGIRCPVIGKLIDFQSNTPMLVLRNAQEIYSYSPDALSRSLWKYYRGHVQLSIFMAA